MSKFLQSVFTVYHHVYYVTNNINIIISIYCALIPSGINYLGLFLNSYLNILPSSAENIFSKKS